MPLDQNWIDDIIDASTRQFKQQSGVATSEEAREAMRAWALKNETRIRKKSQDGWGKDEFTSAAIRILDAANTRQSASAGAAVQLTQGDAAPTISLRGQHVQAAMDDCPNC